MKQGTKGKLTDNLTSYLFVAPYLVFFIIFALVPLVLCIYLSFCQWDGASEIEWIGLQNYKLLFGALGTGQIAKEFWKSVLNTLLFVAVQMPVLMILPLLIALLINRCSGTGKFFMSAFYFPSILSVATVCIIWYFMFDTNAGILNNFFKTNIPWITKQPYAWISIFILSSWWGIGGNMVLYLAGLSNVSKECLEAAALDGAGVWASFIHITLPGLKNTLVYVLTMTTLSCFNVFGQPNILTAGGPDSSTTVAMMNIYNTAFGGSKFGRACAMSILMALIMVAFTISSYKLQTAKDKESV
jgi:ABC superfamily ATP binding cassette transporter, membrane protein